MPLSAFTPLVRDWLESAFEAPTPAQAQAWPAIATGENVLISAPTGSGKTLAAFLWALDRLVAEGVGVEGGAPHATRLVYVSPMKALSYDVERNLRVPLRGLKAQVRVGIRTGDTPQRERAQMLRNPPDILITTPESLYLMLTSRAREILTGVEAVILDEIHAVAATKRGAHLALSIERLQALNPDRELQRIGLSATQSPLEEVARFMVGPDRRARIVDVGATRPLDLRIHVPVESMIEPDTRRPDTRRPDPAPDDQVGDGAQQSHSHHQVGDGAQQSHSHHQVGDGAQQSHSHHQVGDGAQQSHSHQSEYRQGGEATRRSIWPAIYPELLRLVREHRSTIVFVNSRRAAERLALRLNELNDTDGQPTGAGDARPGRAEDPPRPPAEPIARAHHGSLSREERTTIEELLKAGELPCLVATSSLELGIDMGAVDLVIQVESPKSVARGLQRIGRSGHTPSGGTGGVGATSKGRIFPKFRADLLECAVITRLMRDGRIEPTVVPRNALDVLAQQIVAIVASAGIGSPDGGGPITVDELHALVRRTHSYSELTRELLENVLDMLDGRYPSSEFAELRARINWDRLTGSLTPRRGALGLAVTNAGTIPDRGLYAVTLPDGRRVGELDEEMVHEARPGQAFLLGATAWRIEEIGRDRVVVTPAPGAPGAVPFWRGESIGRPKELGAAIGAFSRWAVDQEPETLERDYDLDGLAARNLLDFLADQQAATGVLPSDRTIVVERFRDEIGDWRLCVLSPYGGRIHAAWALALAARIRELHGLESDAIWSDDGIIVHFPDADDPPTADLVLPEPEDVEEAIVSELGSSALFGSRFRENAARALLIPRAYPGRRTPLWQQRLKAQTLLEVARRHPDFPIVLETYRECLRDVLDVPGLVELLRSIRRRDVGLVEVETPRASPFATSLLFDYVANYMYEGDAPNAERRAAALGLDRDLLRELLGQDELRELIDPGALAALEDDLQRRSADRRATGRDELHDILRRLGDLTDDEVADRVLDGLDHRAMVAELERERRVVRVRIGREPRWIAAEHAGLYRDAIGAAPPGGLPDAFLAEVDEAVGELCMRYARSHGPFTSHELSGRYSVDFRSALGELEAAGRLVRGELRPGGSEREWCSPEVLQRLRRASLAALRSEIEAADRRALGVFLPSWQGVDRHPRAGAGIERLREVLVALQGLALPAEVWERDVLPRRLGAYSSTWIDQLCASGELVWVGAPRSGQAPGALGRRGGRVALYFRDDAAAIGPPSAGAGRGLAPAQADHELVRARLAAGPCFFSDLIAELDAPPAALAEAVWDLVWAGEATNDAWAPLRAPRLTVAPRASVGERAGRGPGRSGRRFASSARRGAGAQVQGRWSLTEAIFEPAPDPRARRRTQAELLLERYGILTRELVLAEGVVGGFAALYDSLVGLETLGVCRRGYFIEGLGGAQFALPGAVERLRSQRRLDQAPPLVLAATDPAQPYGAALAWPRRAGATTGAGERRGGAGGSGESTGERSARRPARVAGAHVVLVGAELALYVEQGGRGLQTFTDDPRPGLAALADAVRAGRIGKLDLERIDGGGILGSALEPVLIELGFRAGPRRLTLSA
ncbi:MAG TPA: DEAD/DEAH box helicase [Solirubrobacteraceae bacterium]